jgi:hypothetical protein
MRGSTSKAVKVGVYEETTKSDILNPASRVLYSPAAWMGRKVRGPVVLHQIRGGSGALDIFKQIPKLALYLYCILKQITYREC